MDQIIYIVFQQGYYYDNIGVMNMTKFYSGAEKSLMAKFITETKRGVTTYYFDDDGPPDLVLTQRAIRSNKFNSVEIERRGINSQVGSKLPRASLGDVILLMKGSSLRSAVVDDEEISGAIIGPNLLALSVSDMIDPTFLSSYLNSAEGQAQIHTLSSGSTIKGLTIQNVMDLQIPVPPLPIQKKLSEFFDLLSEYEALIQREYDLSNVINQ